MITSRLWSLRVYRTILRFRMMEGRKEGTLVSGTPKPPSVTSRINLHSLDFLQFQSLIPSILPVTQATPCPSPAIWPPNPLLPSSDPFSRPTYQYLQKQLGLKESPAHSDYRSFESRSILPRLDGSTERFCGEPLSSVVLTEHHSQRLV